MNKASRYASQTRAAPPNLSHKFIRIEQGGDIMVLVRQDNAHSIPGFAKFVFSGLFVSFILAQCVSCT